MSMGLNQNSGQRRDRPQVRYRRQMPPAKKRPAKHKEVAAENPPLKKQAVNPMVRLTRQPATAAAVVGQDREPVDAGPQEGDSSPQ
jgi:hypothetical protein